MVGDRLVKKMSLLRGLTGARSGALEELAQPERPHEGAGSGQAGTGRVGARAWVVPGEQPPQGPGLGNRKWPEQRVCRGVGRGGHGGGGLGGARQPPKGLAERF